MQTRYANLLLPGLMLWCMSAAAAPALAPIAAGGTREIPRWAEAQLAARASARAAYHAFIDRFLEPDGSACVAEYAVSHWGIDDFHEAFMDWADFLVVDGDPEIAQRFVAVWHRYYRQAVHKGVYTNGFYRGDMDYEHAGEGFPHLWGALKVAPGDGGLEAANASFADLLAHEEIFNRETGFLRHAIPKGNRRPPRPYARDADCAGNTQYMAAPFHAWLATADEKYRQWLLRYARAWAGATGANDGAIPYYVDSRTGRPTATWYTAPPLSEKSTGALKQFSYADGWGIAIAHRGYLAWFPAAMLMTGGDTRELDPLVNFLEILMKHGKDGRPAGDYLPGTGWVHYSRMPKGRPYSERSFYTLLELAHRLGFGARTRTLLERACEANPSALPVARFQLLGQGSPEEAVRAFEAGAGRNDAKRKGILAVPDRKPTGAEYEAMVQAWRKHEPMKRDGLPFTGDQLRAHSPDPRFCRWLDGGTRTTYGGPSVAPIRYFHEDGKPGLPRDVAALVTRSDGDRLELLLCNTADASRRILLTGGFYGQDRFETLAADGQTTRLGAARALVELSPRSTVTLTFAVARFAYRPTARPEAGPARPWRP
ncbi:MAG: hypothetical protein JXR37_21530 [Kiritimatiellae bacterium]|nr:hypothetical protein [Kiritimatiellia bacterium]